MWFPATGVTYTSRLSVGFLQLTIVLNAQIFEGARTPKLRRYLSSPRVESPRTRQALGSQTPASQTQSVEAAPPSVRERRLPVVHLPPVGAPAPDVHFTSHFAYLERR